MAGPSNSTSGDAASPLGAAARIPDDAELFRRIAGGDQAAFRAIIDRHGRYLFGVARSLSRNSADAEDLVQETLVGLLNAASAGRFRGESSVRTYLVSILVRQAGMLRRRATRRQEESDAGEPATTGSAQAGVEARLDLHVMLGALSLEHRQVMVLRELEGLSYEEIAQALGVPRGTVESRLHRARATLREKFGGYFDDKDAGHV